MEGYIFKIALAVLHLNRYTEFIMFDGSQVQKAFRASTNAYLTF